MVYQRGNQKESTSHYVFLYSDEENSADEETILLQPRSRTTSSPRKIEVINVQLKSDDTLQALALRYRCTISELKRINKIHKENEIHARRLLKVPVQPFSLLTESLDQSENTCETQNAVAIPALGEATTSANHNEQLLESVKPPVIIESPKAEINAIILNSECEPLASYNSNNSLDTPGIDTEQLLTSVERGTSSGHLTDAFKCSGDDCGLTWTQLLGFSLLLVFAGPIIYIIYIVEFSAKAHLAGN